MVERAFEQSSSSSSSSSSGRVLSSRSSLYGAVRKTSWGGLVPAPVLGTTLSPVSSVSSVSSVAGIVTENCSSSSSSSSGSGSGDQGGSILQQGKASSPLLRKPGFGSAACYLATDFLRKETEPLRASESPDSDSEGAAIRPSSLYKNVHHHHPSAGQEALALRFPGQQSTTQQQTQSQQRGRERTREKEKEKEEEKEEEKEKEKEKEKGVRAKGRMAASNRLLEEHRRRRRTKAVPDSDHHHK